MAHFIFSALPTSFRSLFSSYERLSSPLTLPLVVLLPFFPDRFHFLLEALCSGDFDFAWRAPLFHFGSQLSREHEIQIFVTWGFRSCAQNKFSCLLSPLRGLELIILHPTSEHKKSVKQLHNCATVARIRRAISDKVRDACYCISSHPSGASTTKE